MTNDQFMREKMYQIIMSIMRSLLKSGSLTKTQYKKIDAVMLEKYQPISGNLFSDPDLIYIGSRVINGTGKE